VSTAGNFIAYGAPAVVKLSLTASLY